MSKEAKTPKKRGVVKFSEDIKEKIKQFIEEERAKGHMITTNSLQCFYEEQTNGEIVKIETPELEILGVRKGRVSLIEKLPLENEFNLEKQRLNESIKGLPNEMIFCLDEFGFQLCKLTQKILTIRKNDDDKLKSFFGREVKMSGALICLNKNNEYLTPFLKFAPPSDSKGEIAKRCFILNEEKKTRNVNYFTKNDFKKWFECVVVSYITQLRINLNTDLNAVVIMDEYYKDYLEPFSYIGIKPHYIKSSCSNKLNPIYDIIDLYMDQLKKEYESKINAKDNEFIGYVNELRVNNYFIKTIFEELDEAPLNPINSTRKDLQTTSYYQFVEGKNDIKDDVFFNDPVRKNEISDYIKQLLNENKCVTLDTIKNTIRIRHQIDRSEEEIVNLLLRSGFLLKTDFCGMETKTFNLAEVETFIRGMLYYQDASVDHTIFIDFYDFRLMAANRVKMVVDAQHSGEEMVICRESFKSSFATALLGDGPLLPLLIGLNSFAKEKIGSILEQAGHLTVAHDYITMEDIKKWVLGLVDYVQKLHLKKSPQIPSTAPFLIVAPKYFSEPLQQIKPELMKNNFGFVCIPDNICCITPLSDMLNRVTEGIIRDKLMMPGRDLLTTENKLVLTKKINDSFRIDVVQMVCWPWKYYRDSRQFTLGNIVSEIRKRKECYDYKTFCAPRRYAETDPPFDTFNLLTVPPFYRNSLRAFISSNKFSTASTKQEQMSLLKEDYERFGVITISSIFESQGRLIVKRNDKQN